MKLIAYGKTNWEEDFPSANSKIKDQGVERSSGGEEIRLRLPLCFKPPVKGTG